ncbi:hypothetical protein OG318_59655 (plasmid) [Streptomyces sp. NBC_01483]|nr:hypothetical protein [Streptomyces sp. NBC_01483]
MRRPVPQNVPEPGSAPAARHRVRDDQYQPVAGRVGDFLDTARLATRSCHARGVVLSRAAQIPGPHVPEDAALGDNAAELGHQVVPEQHRVVGVHDEREVQPAAPAGAEDRDREALFDGAADGEFLVKFAACDVAGHAGRPSERPQGPHHGQGVVH